MHNRKLQDSLQSVEARKNSNPQTGSFGGEKGAKNSASGGWAIRIVGSGSVSLIFHAYYAILRSLLTNDMLATQTVATVSQEF